MDILHELYHIRLWIKIRPFFGVLNNIHAYYNETINQ